MILDTRTRRSPFSLPSAALGAVGLAAALVGCAPEPAPSPTPTAAFASEEEAFAAAEETYRAYNDAFNSLDISNSATFDKLFELSSGNFEAADRKTLSELRAEGLTLTGSTTVSYFDGLKSEPPFERITALVCIDVSRSDIVNMSGESVLDASRLDVNPLVVTFVFSDGELLIDRADREEESACVAS